LADGRKVTAELFTTVLSEELKKIENWLGPDRYRKGRFQDAADLFSKITTSNEFVSFLTLPGYERLG